MPFGATGGTAPYTYSLSSDPSGGSIDPSSGLYTSGSANCIDTIRVTDSTSAYVETEIAVMYPLGLVCDIIQTSMGLSQGQVYMWDQKVNIPVDSRLYVAVGIQSCKPFGNRPKYQGGSSTSINIQSINMLATVSIDILSRSTLALDLKEQVLMALTSNYAEQQMELNSFFIAGIPTSLVNVSQVDGTAIPFRFQFLCNMQYFSVLPQAIDYYDVFSTPVVTTEP